MQVEARKSVRGFRYTRYEQTYRREVTWQESPVHLAMHGLSQRELCDWLSLSLLQERRLQGVNLGPA